jgi:hypothetical protein
VPSETLSAFFARAKSRLRLIAGVRGIALALGAGLPLLALRWFGTLSPRDLLVAVSAAVVLVAIMMVWRSPTRARELASEVEARTPAPKNVLITATEIEDTATDLRPDVHDVVLRDAASAASRVDLAALFPVRRIAMWAGVLAVVWAIGLSIDGASVMRARARVLGGPEPAPEIAGVTVTITPASYTGRPAEVLVNPQRIDALAGSTIAVSVDSTATDIELTAVGERHRLARVGGAFTGSVVATADGFIALQPFGANDAVGVRRVMPLAVTPDHAPAARITDPGKDLFLAKPDRSVPVTIEATDDIGLASLSLAYTKVTGSGDNFTFVEGTVPVAITRGPAGASPDRWTATAALPLPSLALEPGDLLVYRALVADRRPNAIPIESDAFVVQILQPGEALVEGFTIDEEKDRYAISQQMIIIKTQRLIDNKAKLSAEEFNDQAQTLAAEQRKVRAEFVFMMGGEFEDAAAEGGDLNEEAEAANESELLAGRMQNNGRRDIITATRYMSRAAQKLTNLRPAVALPDEKAALESLQRAFVKIRYLLRILTPRERIDDARRLSGKLETAVDWRRPVPTATDDPRARALLTFLADVSELVALPAYSSAEANRLSATAEGLLRLDNQLAPVAQAFSRAAAAIGSRKDPNEVRALVDAAAIGLSSAARTGVPTAPASADGSLSRLRGALADALGRSGGRQ